MNEVTSEQVLALARKGEAQRIQKVLIEATKESKQFNAMKKVKSKRKIYLIEPK